MIELVVGDTKPDLSFSIKRGGVDITADVTITAVEFRLRKPVGTVLTKPLTLVTRGDGSKRWEGNFGVGDIDFTSDGLAEVVVFFGSASPQHGREPFRIIVRGEYRESQL